MTMEPITRCGYTVVRGPVYPGSRVGIASDVGPVYIATAVYDRIDDDAFGRFMAAWVAGDLPGMRAALGEAGPHER